MKNWKNIRSNSYVRIDIIEHSKDDSFINTSDIKYCPICLNIIWQNKELFKCPQCKKKICQNCMNTIKENSIANRCSYQCPLCR